MYYHYMQQRIFKNIERQAMVMWGVDLGRKDKAKEQKTLAEHWQADPLYNFPNDILFFTAQQVADKLMVTRHLGFKLAAEKRWTRERADSCLGRHGMVARRCSMNDKLWGLWQKSKMMKAPLTLDQVKKMILLDIKRSKLYPPGWRDDTVNPPDWYLKELKESGRLTAILQEIDEVTKN